MIGYILLGLFLLLLAVLLLRALAFRPKTQPAAAGEPVSFNKEAAVDALAQLVRCRTVSYNDPALEDEAEFRKLIQYYIKIAPAAPAPASWRGEVMNRPHELDRNRVK